MVRAWPLAFLTTSKLFWRNMRLVGRISFQLLRNLEFAASASGWDCVAAIHNVLASVHQWNAAARTINEQEVSPYNAFENWKIF
jgi:hypothetical protein